MVVKGWKHFFKYKSDAHKIEVSFHLLAIAHLDGGLWCEREALSHTAAQPNISRAVRAILSFLPCGADSYLVVLAVDSLGPRALLVLPTVLDVVCGRVDGGLIRLPSSLHSRRLLVGRDDGDPRLEGIFLIRLPSSFVVKGAVSPSSPITPSLKGPAHGTAGGAGVLAEPSGVDQVLGAGPVRGRKKSSTKIFKIRPAVFSKTVNWPFWPFINY